MLVEIMVVKVRFKQSIHFNSAHTNTLATVLFPHKYDSNTKKTKTPTSILKIKKYKTPHRSHAPKNSGCTHYVAKNEKQFSYLYTRLTEKSQSNNPLPSFLFAE